MEFILKVPKPCNESWDEMTPVAGGRNCAMCSKTVVDFTGWQPEDIVSYIHGAGRKVCGRFREEQLNTPIDTDHFILAVATSTMPLVRKVAAIFLVAFGLLSLSGSASAQVAKHKIADTSGHTQKHEHTIMGVAPMPAKKVKMNDSNRPEKASELLPTIRYHW